jgi:hypothetical protein
LRPIFLLLTSTIGERPPLWWETHHNASGGDMGNVKVRGFAVAAIAALAGIAAMAPAASATEVCREATVGSTDALVCAAAALALNQNGMTVAPSGGFGCTLSTDGTPNDPCAAIAGSIRGQTTGFTPGPGLAAPRVDPATGTVQSDGGTVGTVYVEGSARDVTAPPVCVGDPNVC